MDPSLEADIAERMERATRAVIASSPLASYSFSQSSARQDHHPLPSLADLLLHVGPKDCPRCPSCRAPLVFGSRSRICLACENTLVEIPPPSLTSSLAFRRFSEMFGMTDLEGVEEHLSNQSVPSTTKVSSSASLPPMEATVQKSSLPLEVSLDLPAEEHFNTNPQVSQPPTSISSDFSLPASEEIIAPQRHSSILDYSAKLEGISLEDFFSSKGKQEVSEPQKFDAASVPELEKAVPMNSSVVNIQKDSLFWDPLSETIIPDGFDMMAETGRSSSNKEAVDSLGVVEEDPFDSWESDFQSAPPIMPEASISSSFQSQSSYQGGTFEDFFGNPTIRKDGSAERVVADLEEDNVQAKNGNFFGSYVDTTTGKIADIDDLFLGTGWGQSGPLSIEDSGNQTTNGLNEGDLLGPLSFMQKKMPSDSDSSVDFTEGGNPSKTNEKPSTQLQGSESTGKRSLEPLLAQLHDLSFMLSDRLVIKTEGEGNDLNNRSP
ncbi:hypothetical protein KP509_06G053900 [Ceratopteris richardii]|uniref:Uncharacterized protein n=1 Tax=Ceratopteris richardii TaxID=49495 RepID=A0A8T2UNS4_CERRI|nr:hypothetical protein KP509_06G053900 [Ceratopteris richardii]